MCSICWRVQVCAGAAAITAKYEKFRFFFLHFGSALVFGTISWMDWKTMSHQVQQASRDVSCCLILRVADLRVTSAAVPDIAVGKSRIWCNHADLWFRQAPRFRQRTEAQGAVAWFQSGRLCASQSERLLAEGFF